MVKRVDEARLARWFRIAYLLMAMFNFTNITTETVLFSVFTYIVVAFGIVLLCIRLLRVREFFQTPGLLLLVTLIVLYGISSVLNCQYGGITGLISNVKAILWMCFQLLLLYAFRPTSREELMKEVRLVFCVVVTFNFLSVLVSYLMLLFDFSYTRFLSDKVVLYGVIWNRLWGTFSDPNYGAVVSAVATMLSCYFIQENKKVLSRMFHVTNILLSVMYIVYSDSRTGMVVLALGVVVYCFLSLFFYSEKKQRKPISVVTCVVIAVSLAAVVLGSFGVIKTVGLMPRTAYLQIQSNMRQPVETLVPSSSETELPSSSETELPSSSETELPSSSEDTVPINPQEETEVVEDTLEIGRDESGVNNDVSNRRFDIWKSGMEIFMKTPVFGTSFRNMVSFAMVELPQTYIVNNDSGNFFCMHNSLFDILVSQGILGFAVFLIFAMVVIKKALGTLLRKNNKVSREQIVLLSCLVVEAAAAMFVSEIMYINSIGGAIFWIFLGYCMQICHLEEKANA